jgi:membrane protease YdiL (CAAX protease family)
MDLDKEREMTENGSTKTSDQYTLIQILGLWAGAALPMALLGWVAYPLLAPDSASDPLGAGVIRVLLLLLGLVWQFVLAMIVVRKEEGELSWAAVRRRLRLNGPRDPKTGERRPLLWLWVIPALVGIALLDIVLASAIDGAWVSILPFLSEPPGYSLDAIFESPEVMERLVGAWWFLALFVVFSIFNTVLGEEFLFRGVLLPKMEGVFGRWSWVATGVLFGLYHLHQPWGILNTIVGDVFLIALPAWRFRSTWMAVVIHSGQSVFFAFLILGVVLGLA